ncbi:hypothetical protein T4C_9728 [Trichinella pseudospiralis]|uniref:Uncharacterized protein n=1 Tax=Trichinella pseudospiralis TaxID=6337 RepID=A0A0V1GYZ7_TRIPS|nr:hypothetical protein T4C_9728 [Trichinella pseudospiralis]
MVITELLLTQRLHATMHQPFCPEHNVDESQALSNDKRNCLL